MGQSKPIQPNAKFLAESVRAKRGNLSVRDAAAQAGMSSSTFSRIENGHWPDEYNLCLICGWMGDQPGKYFTSESGNIDFPISVHLRAAKDMTPEEAKAFIELIRTTYNKILDEREEPQDDEAGTDL